VNGFKGNDQSIYKDHPLLCVISLSTLSLQTKHTSNKAMHKFDHLNKFYTAQTTGMHISVTSVHLSPSVPGLVAKDTGTECLS